MSSAIPRDCLSWIDDLTDMAVAEADKHPGVCLGVLASALTVYSIYGRTSAVKAAATPAPPQPEATVQPLLPPTLDDTHNNNANTPLSVSAVADEDPTRRTSAQMLRDATPQAAHASADSDSGWDDDANECDAEPADRDDSDDDDVLSPDAVGLRDDLLADDSVCFRGGAVDSHPCVSHILHETWPVLKYRPPVKPVATMPVVRSKHFHFYGSGNVIIRSGSTGSSKYTKTVDSHNNTVITVNAAYPFTKDRLRNALRFVSAAGRVVYVFSNALPILPVLVYKEIEHVGGRCVYIDREDSIIHSEVFAALNKNALVGAPNARPLMSERLTVDYTSSIAYLRSSTDAHAAVIQSFINDFMRGTTFQATDHLVQQFHYSDFESSASGVAYTNVVAPYKHGLYDRMRPVINSACPDEQMPTARHTIYALQKRNCDPPQQLAVSDVLTEAQGMLDILLSLCDTSALVADPISVGYDDVMEWANDQMLSSMELLIPDTGFECMGLNEYQLAIKRTPKPDLTPKALDVYPAPQTILFHPKSVNAVFCVVWRHVRDRIVAALHPRFVIYTCMTEDEFAMRMTHVLPPERLAQLYRVECDMSKYDKSQHELILYFELAVLRFFGVSEHLISMWENAHRACTATDRATKLKVYTQFQRKSGDASTFIGNTLALMVVLMDSMSIADVSFACFSGDDSVVYTTQPPSTINVDKMALKYNLECKLFLDYEYSYFCSKFLLTVGGRWYFLPDPLKRAVKLGRRDLRNPQHVEQFRVSYRDNVRHYKSPIIAAELAKALCERYRVEHNHTTAILALGDVARKAAFHELYYSLDGDVLCYDVSLPREE